MKQTASESPGGPSRNQGLPSGPPAPGLVKFELHGEELSQKTVTPCGSCGRVYLPLTWVGKKVKIIRMD